MTRRCAAQHFSDKKNQGPRFGSSEKQIYESSCRSRCGGLVPAPCSYLFYYSKFKFKLSNCSSSEFRALSLFDLHIALCFSLKELHLFT